MPPESAVIWFTPPTSPSAAASVRSPLMISTEPGRSHFAHDKHFLLAAIEHIDDIAMLEHQVLARVGIVVKRFEVDLVTLRRRARC